MPRKTQKKTKVSISCTSLQHTRKEPPRKLTGLLTCIYTNTHSMDKKLEELEAVVQQENYNSSITSTWWDSSHSWSMALGGYKLLRRDRLGRRGGAGLFRLTRA